MKKKQRPQKPTDGELAILRVLWEKGPSTVREVMKELNRHKPTGYNTVLKFMQIMTEKGLLQCDKTEWRHVYEPTIPEQDTQSLLVVDLMDKAFSGNARNMVIRALSEDSVSEEDLSQIRQMLDELEDKRK